MSATTIYTESQIAELKEFAKENRLSFEEAIEYCSVCHYCGSKVGFCQQYCNERCQDYSTCFNYPCFRGNLCKICSNGSLESTKCYVIEPTNPNSVCEIQVWTKLFSPTKFVEVMHIVQCSWGSFTIDITNKEKDRLLENTLFINTRNTKIHVNDLHETGNSCIEVVNKDEDELSDEEIADLERDPDIINTPGWILRSVYYEIFNGFSLHPFTLECNTILPLKTR